MNPITRRPEPLFNRAAIVAIVSAVLMLLTSFGVPITPEQQDAIRAVVGLVSPFVLWWITRPHTTPVTDPRDEDGNALVREDWK